MNDAQTVSERYDEDEAAAQLLLVDVDRCVRRSAPNSILIALLVAALYWPWANHKGTIVAVSLIALALVPYYVWIGRRNANRATLTVGTLAKLNALGCIAWATTPWLMMPDSREGQYFMVALAFAIMVANVADSAALRAAYLTSQIPMVIILALGFAIGADGAAKLVAVLVLLAAFYLDNVAKTWSETAMEAARLRCRNERLLTELRDANEILRHESTHDYLTGISNRAAFSANLSDALESWQSEGFAEPALLLIDLDGFKEVNDSFGHQAGDRVLIEAASRLQMCAPTEAIVARLGGDELAMVWRGPSSVEAVREYAQTIVEVMREPIAVGSGKVQISVSVGVALAKTPGVTETRLLNQADVALYAAKTGGRDRYVLYENPGLENKPAEVFVVGDL